MLASSSAFTGRPCLLLKQSANQLKKKPGTKLISVKHLCHHNNIRSEHNISSEQPKKRLLIKTKVAENTSPSKTSSILCSNCDGNGMVQCSQCKGDGVNSTDHFNGQFKAGEICWLCRGKKEMLCGDCNGAGFMGGFMSTTDG